jgi:hypothetical protein
VTQQQLLTRRATWCRPLVGATAGVDPSLQQLLDTMETIKQNMSADTSAALQVDPAQLGLPL